MKKGSFSTNRQPSPFSFFRYFPQSERDQKWGLFLLTAGEARIPPGWPYPPTQHPQDYQFSWAHGRVLQEYQLVYIARGQGNFESEGTSRVRVESGNIMLLFPRVWHRYAPDPETGWDEYWIGFGGDIADRLAREKFFSSDRPVLRARHEAELLDSYRQILEAMNSNGPALQQIMAGWAMRILALLYRTQQGGNQEEDPTTVAIRDAIRIMHANVDQLLDLETLAEELNVSYTCFRRKFKGHTGLSPHQYQLNLQLARARRLLSETTLPIKQVAAISGFTDEQYFCRIFKQKNGQTPGTWRDRCFRQPE